MDTFLSRKAAIVFVATPILCFAISWSADAADGPNRLSSSDVAAGRFVDSLLSPRMPMPGTRPSHPQRRPAMYRSGSLRGKLVHNPNAQSGEPEFALVDRYGKILRYVEPSRSVSLEAYLGQTVAVRHDTGRVLLASQLALPRSQSSPRGDTGLQLVQHEEPIPAGEPVPADAPEESIKVKETTQPAPELYYEEGPVFEEGPIYLDGEYDDGLDFGGCPSCGSYMCRQFGGCGIGSRGIAYAHAEYLLWWMEGMNTPPLVIQFQNIDLTNPAAPVVEGPVNTIYGGSRVLEDERNGGRLTLGFWLDDLGEWGLEGDWLALSTLDDSFVAGERDGQVPALGDFIGRPFFNTGIIGGDLNSRGRSQEDVDTNRLDGTVRVDVESEFQSAGLRLRQSLCCRDCNVGCGDCVGCGAGVGCGSPVGVGIGPLEGLAVLLTQGTRRVDVLYGLRWASLDESLMVTEDLQEFVNITVNPPTLGDEIDVLDRFAVENDFFGGELGYETNWQYGRWSLNLLSKLAIGNTRQRVSISGSTTVDGEMTPANNIGGLLTQRYEHPGADGMAGTADDFVVGNIGDYERDEFSMLPELGLTLGYNLTQQLKFTAGYTLLYWSNVVRPGDQIDLDVNANLLPRRDGDPDPATIVFDDHPRFDFRQTDLWLHGLNLGAEYTW